MLKHVNAAVAAVLVLLGGAAIAHEEVRTAPARTVTAPPELPPLPPGVAELKFKDFYKLPVGPYGLEPTATLLGLDGRRVRISGYMVKREHLIPGSFILAPLPVTMHDEADGAADDLPPSIVHVVMPAAEAAQPVPHQRGLFLLTGTLQLGVREEPDGRISYVRLLLDPRPAPATRAAKGARPAAAKPTPPGRVAAAH